MNLAPSQKVWCTVEESTIDRGTTGQVTDDRCYLDSSEAIAELLP